jgi:hypothetical protein
MLPSLISPADNRLSRLRLKDPTSEEPSADRRRKFSAQCRGAPGRKRIGGQLTIGRSCCRVRQSADPSLRQMEKCLCRITAGYDPTSELLHNLTYFAIELLTCVGLAQKNRSLIKPTAVHDRVISIPGGEEHRDTGPSAAHFMRQFSAL